MPQWRKTAQVFILFAFIVVTVDAGDDLSDFSNDLATDVGPLLVLFGESMTKQYLSESTSFLDYFIFAMAPIGILTAIVSSIRVCGSTWLRAFIGRSQEGDGVIEAELCTSTGRDVCELFNRGGITRVLGRPTILELVHVPQNDQKEQATGPDKAKLFLFRDYLKKYDEDETKNDWKRVQGSLESDDGNPFAPNPNLSLNVGIVKPPNKAFFAVAAVGFVLQAGVLSLAGVGVWVLGWNLNQGNSVASRYYAPIMFIAGTVTTYEIRYKRQDNVDSHSRLFWLQPGPQVIGDQCFDPFAHFENKIESDDDANNRDERNNRLRAWTSSKKNFDQKFEFYTIVAVLTTLIGYITQFIGLRGMKAWVSLAQLGITVVMSILRGLLRTQRLGRNDNKLRRMPDLVTGYELDWLAFEIAGLDSEILSCATICLPFACGLPI
ncbi:hypothetical protein EDB81DRAFT_843997 [Dactylonectria macrodidyma]|uniref:Uncharacterized protein n=1 Tax=Dactylonectria macrodidyma TaxID=307937 RepID=A0A9P9ENG1_9HYPO|nr:hypothetical protein EDB81DRAFT_843997 [Dactylonectria macrodidyma]